MSGGERVPSACWLPPELRVVIAAMPGGAAPFRKRYERAGAPGAPGAQDAPGVPGAQDAEHLDVAFERLSPAALAEVVAFLRRRRREVLGRRTVQQIVDVLDRAAARWLDASYPPRRQTIDDIAFVTGFSPAMVAHAIEEEQVSSRGPHLLEALRSELGDPELLDGFRPNRRLGGFSRGRGPELVGAIFSSNIPALPHLEIMRSFLVKGACLGRVSAGEPIFLARYAETLQELDAELASCLAICYWERGDDEAEQAFLGSIDYLVAYGGDAQIHRLMAQRPPALDATWHGHRLGFQFVTREALAAPPQSEAIGRLARALTYDFAIFDGLACLCPQVCIVEEGGATTPRQLAERCGEELARWARELPPRRLELGEASRKHTYRALALMSEAREVVAAPDDVSYLVTFEGMRDFEPSCGERLMRVVPVAGEAELDRLVGRLPRQVLQCAAIAAGGAAARHVALREKLASWGVTRVVPPGIMGRPSMMWHHDGTACLGRMITWCDHELVVPERLLGEDVDELLAATERDPSRNLGAALAP